MVLTLRQDFPTEYLSDAVSSLKINAVTSKVQIFAYYTKNWHTKHGVWIDLWLQMQTKTKWKPHKMEPPVNPTVERSLRLMYGRTMCFAHTTRYWIWCMVARLISRWHQSFQRRQNCTAVSAKNTKPDPARQHPTASYSAKMDGGRAGVGWLCDGLILSGRL